MHSFLVSVCLEEKSKNGKKNIEKFDLAFFLSNIVYAIILYGFSMFISILWNIEHNKVTVKIKKSFVEKTCLINFLRHNYGVKIKHSKHRKKLLYHIICENFIIKKISCVKQGQPRAGGKEGRLVRAPKSKGFIPNIKNSIPMRTQILTT